MQALVSACWLERRPLVAWTVGDLEPVGVHADHRRLGLGQAVCFDALRALAELGAQECLIFSSPDIAGSEALYASLGATVATTSRRYARPIAG
jgi:predicted N-acetyltransferase YhbS